MKDELKYIGERIIANKNELVNTTVQDSESINELPKSFVLEWRSELIEFLGESLFKDKEKVLEKVKHWAHKIGNKAVEDGVPLDLYIKSLGLFRTVIWESFSEELAQNNFAAITMLDVSRITDPIIDEISYIFSHVYVEYNQRMMEATYNTLQQLSVPVVPLSEGIAVLPLIGEIDTYRSQLIMETSLERSTTLQIENLIIDVSGVPIVDTIVANNLFQIVHALKLIGVETTITGIRPEIAQTMVSLGIEFKEIITLANLQHALSEIGFTQSR